MDRKIRLTIIVSGNGTSIGSLAGHHRQAFTIVELLIVIGIMALLIAILLPGLSLAQEKAQGMLCLNNLNQLQICAKLYSSDNDGFLLPNQNVYDLNTLQPLLGTDSSKTWCYGLAPYDQTTENIKRGMLYPYNKSTDIYRCPSDRSWVRTRDGKKLLPIQRTRSYNLSQSINGLPYQDNKYLYPPSFSHESEINAPSPSELFFFIDVHEEAIFDSHFGIPPRGWPLPNGPKWWDLPAGRHSQGCNFSFADGHVERWDWVRPKIFTEPGQFVRQDGEIKDFERVQRGVKSEIRF